MIFLSLVVRRPFQNGSESVLPGTTRVTSVIRSFLLAIIEANTQLRLNPTIMNLSTPLSLWIFRMSFLIFWFTISKYDLVASTSGESISEIRLYWTYAWPDFRILRFILLNMYDPECQGAIRMYATLLP